MLVSGAASGGAARKLALALATLKRLSPLGLFSMAWLRQGLAYPGGGSLAGAPVAL